MYGTKLGVGATGVGTAVLGLKVTKSATGAKTLPFTGLSTTLYVLLAIALLVTGLLLARLGHVRRAEAREHSRLTNVLACLLVAGAGIALLVFSAQWRGFETWAAAHTIHLATGDATRGVVSNGIVVILHHHGASMFALTTECTVAQILGALLIGGAPLLLVRRLSLRRVASALGLAALVLVIVNVIRLTMIGVAINSWGHNGFAISHTYLGSLVTFVGTCLAGVVFALVLIARRRSPEANATPAV